MYAVQQNTLSRKSQISSSTHDRNKHMKAPFQQSSSILLNKNYPVSGEACYLPQITFSIQLTS